MLSVMEELKGVVAQLTAKFSQLETSVTDLSKRLETEKRTAQPVVGTLSNHTTRQMSAVQLQVSTAVTPSNCRNSDHIPIYSQNLKRYETVSPKSSYHKI